MTGGCVQYPCCVNAASSWMSRVHVHFASRSTDPFNRQPLTREMLKPGIASSVYSWIACVVDLFLELDQQLKDRIDAFKRRGKKAAPSL